MVFLDLVLAVGLHYRLRGKCDYGIRAIDFETQVLKFKMKKKCNSFREMVAFREKSCIFDANIL